ncbi:MAG: GIY-YIG nuclease family protein [Marinobacterium sp.]|nr:GIY-YIG nuclease family protein [Marinobacterium sp.]
MNRWYIYMVRCVDDTLYTGITTDLRRRIAQHNGVRSGGARYTRARRPVELVWYESSDGRSAASRREREIKGLARRDKLGLIVDVVLFPDFVETE